ncbi:MucBP domain-containing protein [Listeria swaminathanii]|uniref:MucBP domain-containing protein n=1 Tax=Listeria swaminathanii TaxID=2713501 RepID=A0ABU2IBX5_9LIST|nr:MucBP domain-containing protein [Listeria swaminathanii]MDT0016516.1 MucBP domain-containing protein [Listeria swaminathanii]MDT0021952.1 MucBP domain-containing protein [Listeria swaminathanii]MDT0032916.1 MucBP domain-containing protein [Listeria swaminathanii]MDT0051234.1 MucBP domain-containing protein [Listeria swaminathanii]MDT0053999.1 MucBP domain-containing protein [Listeria swaminathanii]
MKRKISSIIVVGILLFQSLSAYPFITEAKENEQNIETNTPSKETKGLTNSLKQTKTTLKTGDTYDSVFPDSALATVIAKAATGSVDTTQLVTQEDLNKITSLSANSKGISELTGMDLLINVTSISLNSNQITDISPINQLPNLVSLALKNNQISSITLNAQSQLPKLTSIDLETNPVLKIIDIQDQPQLVELKTSSNTGLRQLTTVIAKNNPELVNLGYYTMRNVYFSQVASLTKVELANLPKVTKVSLDRNSISELEISDLAIENLPLNGNKLTDNVFDNLQNLPNLKTLDLSLNQLTEVELDKTDVENLPNLISLNMEGNSELTSINVQDQPQLVDIKTSINTGLRQLTTVIAKNNPELVNLGYYTMRNVYFSQVASLTKVELVNLPKVTKVSLDRNSISELKVTDLAIENLPVQGNELTGNVFDNLQNLPNLKTLDLSQNQLTEVKLDKTDVENLPNLVSINIEQNLTLTSINIQDQPQLVDVKTSDKTGLSKLTTVTAKNNPELVNLGYFSIQSVYFEGIISLTNVELVNLPKVRVVRLDRNSINHIELNNLVSVTEVNLNYNKITSDSIEKFKDMPILATLNLNSNQITNIDVLNDLPEITTLNVELNSIGVLPSNLKTKMPKLTTLSAVNQTITLDKVITLDDADLIINNEISNFGKLSQPIPISNSGTYADGKLTWSYERIKSLTEVNYQFSERVNTTGIDGTFSGKVTQPFKRSTVPVINADTEIHYPQGTEKTEAAFLSDIHAQTNDDLAIKSDFEIMVNLKKVGTYTVTLSAENMDGIKAVPKEVTVHIDSVQGANITVKYEDESGNKVAEDSILAGNIGEEYNSSAKEILGYTLTEMPTNAQGEISLEEQTVRYIYSKNPLPAENITVKYTDEEGMELAASDTLSGHVDEDYVTTAKAITGYTLMETPSNAEGKFTDSAQIVTYVYRAIQAEPILAKEVTVNYQDELGAKISETEVLTGEIGETYTTVAKTIEGYTLIESPTNADGIFSETPQTVTYVYQLQNTPIAANVTVKHLDENKNELVTSEVLSGTAGGTYTTKPKQIDGYSLVKVPNNASGNFTTEAQTVIYLYKKNTIPTSNIIVKYEDETGKELATSIVLNGNIHDSYTTVPKEIKGYTLVKKPANATGKFIAADQTIKYLYHANKEQVNRNIELLGDNSNGDIQRIKGNIQPMNGNQQTILPRTGNQSLTLIFGLGILLVILSIIWLFRNKREKNKSKTF